MKYLYITLTLWKTWLQDSNTWKKAEVQKIKKIHAFVKRKKKGAILNSSGDKNNIVF